MIPFKVEFINRISDQPLSIPLWYIIWRLKQREESKILLPQRT